MTRVKTRDSSQNSQNKVKFNFDVSMLNVLIKYVRCEYIARSDLYNLKKLMEYSDLELYRSEQPVYLRLGTLQSLLKAMVDMGLEDDDLIKSQLKIDFEPGIDIIEDVGFTRNGLTVSECERVTQFVTEKLQYIEIYQKRDSLVNLLRKIDDTADYNVSYYDTIQSLKESMSELLASLQNSDQNQGLLQEFAFTLGDASKILTNVVGKMKQPTAILQTGIRQLNAILSPGFQSGRLYTIVGGSGKFKSGTLLNIADQIRRFNPQILPYENGLRKCILFITLENSIEESIERLFDMYSGMDSDIRKTSPEEVVRVLKEEGGYGVTSGGVGGIDIYFRYAGNLEISTADIYAYVTDLNNKGYQPICIVVDYIKRIESAHNSNGDERVRMSFVTKELKSIAQFYEIPVITAMQLNREGNSIIDAAMRDNKQDVARFVGSSSIGNAWDIIEDSDWVALINLELQKSTQRLFLTIKRLKIRGKQVPFTVDYFNHPFANAKNIRLESDVDKPEPISIISLANDLESINEESSERKAFENLQNRNRERKSSSSIVASLKGTVASNMTM